MNKGNAESGKNLLANCGVNVKLKKITLKFAAVDSPGNIYRNVLYY
jgi:hypothetical protein